MKDYPKFGPAGNSELFYSKGFKKTEDAPSYLREMGLNAYEYQCGRGVRINENSFARLKENALLNGISISLHAPYYISLSSKEEEKRLNSVNYILDSARAVDLLGGNRIVVHSGSCSKMSREQALFLAKDTLKLALRALEENNLSHIRICPETMGKVNQLGDLDEVLELCTLSESMLPCIDFGHLNARTFGNMQTYEQFDEALKKVENKLGKERLKEFHSHFSKIEFTNPGGEKRHLTFEDENFGPCFQPLAELVFKYDLHPTFICESAGTQDIDSLAMKKMYEDNFKK